MPTQNTLLNLMPIKLRLLLEVYLILKPYNLITVSQIILYIIQPGNVFFMHMILMDSVNELAMNLGETYLVTKNGNERLGKKKLDLVVL